MPGWISPLVWLANYGWAFDSFGPLFHFGLLGIGGSLLMIGLLAYFGSRFSGSVCSNSLAHCDDVGYYV